MLSLISILIVIGGCSSNTTMGNSEQLSENHTSEAIVLGKKEEQQKILLTTDTKKQDLSTLTEKSVKDIISTNDTSLIWLDISQIPEKQFNTDTLKIGSKIRFILENEQLDTTPPTCIAKEIELIS